MADVNPSLIDQQKQQCPFCKIIKGEIPSKKVFDNDKTIAILDIHPAEEGHILIMPKEHYPIMPLIPPPVFKDVFNIAARIADILKVIYLKEGTTIFMANGAAAGQQSSHFMLHVIPRDSRDQAQFKLSPSSVPVDPKRVKQISETLSYNLSIMLKQEYESFPIKDESGNPVPLKQRYSKDHIIRIINQNPQLKDAMIKEPMEFKKVIPQNPQLRDMFREVDPDEVIEFFVPHFKETQRFEKPSVSGGIQRYVKEDSDEEIDVPEVDEDYDVSSSDSSHPGSGRDEDDGREEDWKREDNSSSGSYGASGSSRQLRQNAEGIRVMSEDELVQFIESKPKLKDALINDFDNFLAELPKSEKMSGLFKGHDPKRIRDRLDKSGLDLVSRLF